MQGFNALDEWGRFDEAFAALRQWEARGSDQAPPDRLRGRRVVRRRPQRPVHRGQHRQDAGQAQRTNLRARVSGLTEDAVQRLLRVGQGLQHLGPGLGELLLLLVGAGPGDRAGQPRDFEECSADLEDVAELGRPPQERVRGLAADPRQASRFWPSSVSVATPLSTVTTPRPASSPMASSARSCGGVKAPSVASDTRCTTCAASAGPSSSIAAVTNAARLRNGPAPGAETTLETRAAGTTVSPAFSAPAATKTGATKTGATKTGAAESAKGAAEAGSAEAAAEESTTRHRCRSFPHRTIKLLDTTGCEDVKEIDGCLSGTASRVSACGA